MKPILFNTDMVRAILEGRKTVTRRVVKKNGVSPADYGRERCSDLRNELNGDTDHLWAEFYKDSDIFCINGETHIDSVYFKSPYQPGDILYVRETWSMISEWTDVDPSVGMFDEYIYKADWSGNSHPRWYPSIHMPREAARIFLRVTDVRVERLWDITEDEARKEGAQPVMVSTDPQDTPNNERTWHEWFPALPHFIEILDSTINPKDRDKYGWAANPWVWVISFERIDKPEATP